MTYRQTLALLNDIRQYGRAWMHHEAAALILHYGTTNDASTGRDVLTGVDAGHAVSHPPGDLLLRRGISTAAASHVGRFFRRAKSFVHELILAGALALYGPTEIDADDMREVDAQAEVQTRYLDRFHDEVKVLPPPELASPEPYVPHIPIVIEPSAKGPLQPMSAKQFEARAEQYGDAVWGSAQEVQRKRMIRGGQYVEEKRVHGKLVDDMCETCSAAVAAGWQPVGTLPRIGDSECMGSCHCYFVWRDDQGNMATSVRKFKLHKGTKRVPPIHVAPKPAPVPVEVKPEPAFKIEVPKPSPVPKVEVPPVQVPQVPKVEVPKVPSIGKPKSKTEPVKVTPLEYAEKAPQFIVGPWLDENGNAITYHSTADYDDS